MNATRILRLLLTGISLCIPLFFFSQNCNNVGFENGTFEGWKAYTGHCCGAPVDVEGVVDGRHTLIHDSVPDGPTMGQLYTKPPFGGGEYVVRLGNSNIGGEAERLVKTFTVDESSKFFVYQYAVVLEDPGHLEEEQPKFEVRVYDSAGNIVSPLECGQYTVTAGPETNNWYWAGPTVRFRDWTTIGLDLEPYMNTEISIEFYVQDCALLGHFGYAYFNATCGFLEVTHNFYCEESESMILSGPDGFATYYWPETGDSTQTMAYPDPHIGDTVLVQMSTESMCQTNMLHIFETLDYDFPYIQTIGDTAACAGEELLLRVNNPNDLMYYDWYANGTHVTDESEITVYPTENTLYEVVLTSDTVCRFTDTVRIQVTVRDEHIFEPFSLLVCPGDSVVMTFPMEDADEIKWQYLGVYTDSDTMAIRATQEDIINVMSSLGSCSFSTSIPLNFYPKPDFSLAADDYDLCPGDSVRVSAEVPAASSFEWFVDGGFFTTAAAFEDVPQENTFYVLHVKDTNNCVYEDSIFIQKSAFPEVFAGRDTVLCQEKKYEIQASGDGGTYLWTNGDTDLNTEVFESGDFIIQAQDSGCYKSDTIHVEFLPYVEIGQIPNIFTPDRNTVNDEFYFYSQNLEDFSILIVNRWGNPVFESHDPHDFWKGYTHEEIVSEGVYFYKLSFTIPCTGEHIGKNGNITVEYLK